MTNGKTFDQQATYQIRVGGNLDPRWSDWFGGLTITPLPDNQTLLVGTVQDQAALHGMLNKICELGLPLLLLVRRDPDPSPDRAGNGGTDVLDKPGKTRTD